MFENAQIPSHVGTRRGLFDEQGFPRSWKNVRNGLFANSVRNRRLQRNITRMPSCFSKKTNGVLQRTEPTFINQETIPIWERQAETKSAHLWVVCGRLCLKQRKSGTMTLSKKRRLSIGRT